MPVNSWGKIGFDGLYDTSGDGSCVFNVKLDLAKWNLKGIQSIYYHEGIGTYSCIYQWCFQYHAGDGGKLGKGMVPDLSTLTHIRIHRNHQWHHQRFCPSGGIISWDWRKYLNGTQRYLQLVWDEAGCHWNKRVYKNIAGIDVKGLGPR